MTTTYRVTFEIEIDHWALARHDGNLSSPPNDPEEWYPSDLFRAISVGIVEAADTVIDIDEMNK